MVDVWNDAWSTIFEDLYSLELDFMIFVWPMFSSLC